MATNTTRLGLRRVTGTDLFKPYTIDLPAIVDRLDLITPQFRSALAAQQVRDVGEAGQIRAGRALTPADFTRMGLAAPLGLWNLGDVNDASGAGRTLTNKGAVPFGVGIMGAATEAAIFAGSTAQALYIADTGAADPFRIRSGSVGAWFRTAKRGTAQVVIGKDITTAGQRGWFIDITTANAIEIALSPDGTTVGFTAGTSDVADDRWHFVVATFDATRVRLYLDGAPETPAGTSGAMFATPGPLNIGGRFADAAVATTNPFYGRVDEAFVSPDVLSPEQVLNLYCSRIAHTLADGASVALAPTGARMAVRRRRRGGPLATSDFPAPPVRLHNFTAGALTEASGGVALAPVGGGTIVTVAAPDGVRDGAYSFSGAHTGLGASDTTGVGGATNSLPAGTASRSYGVWFKTTTGTGTITLISWGTSGTGDATMYVTTGAIRTVSGADSIVGSRVDDGLWHQAMVVEDNAAADGVKRKLYVDGRLVVGSTVLNTLTLTGANRFRVGAYLDGSSPFVGQIDAPFVFAGALTAEQVRALYNVGSLALAASPKSEGDHVEALETTGLLAHFDALEGCDLVDLSVVG